MTARSHVLVGLLGLVSAAVIGPGACTAPPDNTCDVDLDVGQRSARLCEATELISQCLTDAEFDVANATDEALADEIAMCEGDYELCSALPATQDMVSPFAFDEIRGNTDRCG